MFRDLVQERVTSSSSSRPRRSRPEPFPKDLGIRGVLFLGLLLQLLLLAAALWPTVAFVLWGGAWAVAAWQWTLLLLGAVLIFNYAYLVALLVARLIIPVPQEGAYPVVADKPLPRQVIVFMLNVLLVRARFEPPWAATFSAALSRLHPLRWFFNRWFGPRSETTVLGDTIWVLDPHLVEIGRNVQLGFHCTIAAHLFDNRKLIIRRVVIEDHAVIGGEAGLQPGVHVGHHAVVAGRAHVMAGTRIGPYEYWAGDPAVRVKTLGPAEHGEAGAADR